MGRIIFITGGARSGKSSFAVKIAKESKRKVVFLATCLVKDKEMAERVKKHRENRPKGWQTIEESKDISSVIKGMRKLSKTVIIDCVTLLVSNLMREKFSDLKIMGEIEKILKTIKDSNLKVIIVSNEVGSGIVPMNKLARRFRDIAGKVNQVIAKHSDLFYLMSCGIAMKIKSR